MEDISDQINAQPASSFFNALVNVFNLQAITDEEMACQTERIYEYLQRAFEKKMPPEISRYCHLLSILLKQYDDQHHISAASELEPHELLKTLLEEEHLM